MKTHKTDEKRKKLFSELGHKSLKKYDHESLETDMPIHETLADKESTKRKSKTSKVTAEESEGKMTSKTKNGPYPKTHVSKEGKGKVAKVMHEMKNHKLHSGSKKGPIVTNKKQGLAIALSESGLSKKKHKK